LYVIGTAGHIDHGKSALIYRLTGIDPDRLREEKERGMTIDLGFAWLKLPDGKEIGIIDVPGHEKFIKNMLAGVGAIDLALLVIAASESVKPQTREHLDILELLELKKGIVVITKKDLVDEDTVNLVKLEAEDLVKGTFLEKSPVIAVSATTGEGIPELLKMISDELLKSAPRPDLGRPRLFVDRVFSITGAGTIVTGTLIDGYFSTGQEIEVLPSGIKVRIRGLQSHKTQTEKAEPGSRVAVNLANIAPDKLQRGDVLTVPRWLIPSNRFDARLKMLPAAGNHLKHGAIVSLFTGSAETMATVHLLDRDELKRSEDSIVQITTEEKIAPVKGDHFIIRSPMATLGGGVIIEPRAKRHKRFRTDIVEKIEGKETGSEENIVLNFIESTPLTGAADISVKCNLSGDSVKDALESLEKDKKVISLIRGNEKLYLTIGKLDEYIGRAKLIAGNYHRDFPARPGMPKGEFVSRLGLGPGSPILNKLFQDGMLVEDGTAVRLPEFAIKLSVEQQKKIDEFMGQLKKGGYSPQVEVMLDKDLLNRLIDQKKAVKISENIVFPADIYEEMVNKITGHIREKGKVTVAEVRDMFNTSRKYAVTLLEYMDEKKITRRVGDERVLR